MCFKPPKPPPVVEDPELKRQQEEARAQAQEIRSQDKKKATAYQLLQQQGRIGRASLLSGGQGGAGFNLGNTMRSLLAVAG